MIVCSLGRTLASQPASQRGRTAPRSTASSRVCKLAAWCFILFVLQPVSRTHFCASLLARKLGAAVLLRPRTSGELAATTTTTRPSGPKRATISQRTRTTSMGSPVLRRGEKRREEAHTSHTKRDSHALPFGQLCALLWCANCSFSPGLAASLRRRRLLRDGTPLGRPSQSAESAGRPKGQPVASCRRGGDSSKSESESKWCARTAEARPALPGFPLGPSRRALFQSGRQLARVEGQPLRVH